MGNHRPGILDLCMRREIREAFLRRRSQKTGYRNEEYNKLENYILSDACIQDLNRLVRREYWMPPPVHYRVPKNLSGRKRDVYTWKGSVKYLLQLISFALRDYDDIYSDGLYSFRTSRTAQDFLRVLRDSNHSSYYIIKADISNYVGSIVPEKIIPMLDRIWEHDPALLDLMKFLLLRRECIEKDGRIVTCEPGGLGGVPLANTFMNVYLMELDEYFYPRTALYCRYSDDIIIFAKNREEAESYRCHLLMTLKKLDLSTNEDKTRLIEPGGEVEILGCKVRNGTIDISDHSKRKLKRKIRMRTRKLLRLKRQEGLTDEECGRRMADYCNKLFFGSTDKIELTWARWLFPVITETGSLKELDRYVQDAIRYSMCGSLKKMRYRIRYQELKALGCRSLVHAYYHFEC